jgi:hypothetical protein
MLETYAPASAEPISLDNTLNSSPESDAFDFETNDICSQPAPCESGALQVLLTY